MTIKELPPSWITGTVADASKTVDIRFAMNRKVDEHCKAAIVFLNGRTEWIEKNCELATDLNTQEGTVFLTLDHRGQGGSGGTPSYVNSYDDYANDVAKVIAETLDGLPYALVCHSMGGLIGIYGSLKQILKPRAMVCSAPLLALPPEPIPHVIARPAASLLSAIGLKKCSTGAGHHERAVFETNILTHSHKMYELIRNTPYRIPGATFGWVKATFKALDYVHHPDVIARNSVPTRILSPSEEKVIDPKGSAQWVQAASSVSNVPVQLDVIHGARHELFSEIEKYRAQAVMKTTDWLNQHFYV